MSVYLKLFLAFLEIGAVSFGGGYGMIALMREKSLANGWLTADSFLNMVAVAESTPGPVAVNIATFVGANSGGFLGSLCATVGVILPSFIVILVIAALIKNLMKFAGVQAVVKGMKPAVTGVIFATAISLLVKAIFAIEKFGEKVEFSYSKLIIFTVIIAVFFGYKKIFKKNINPIFLIVISAGLGLALCPFIP
ncbi:MAG: chromate transporter [Clostridia bacterium]|nr:chromate transporter [Clostridia bacterium]